MTSTIAPRVRFGWLAVALAILLVGVGDLPTANATTHLVFSTPSAGARLTATPPWVSLEFDQPVTSGTLTLRNEAGRDGTVGAVRREGSEISVDVDPRLPQGTWTVTYAVRSAVGSAAGSFRFSVGSSGSETDTVTPGAGPGSPSSSASSRPEGTRTETKTVATATPSGGAGATPTDGAGAAGSAPQTTAAAPLPAPTRAAGAGATQWRPAPWLWIAALAVLAVSGAALLAGVLRRRRDLRVSDLDAQRSPDHTAAVTGTDAATGRGGYRSAEREAGWASHRQRRRASGTADPAPTQALHVTPAVATDVTSPRGAVDPATGSPPGRGEDPAARAAEGLDAPTAPMPRRRPIGTTDRDSADWTSAWLQRDEDPESK